MTGLLNAVLIDHVKNVSKEDRYDNHESPFKLIPSSCVIPGPIAEYFKIVSNTTMAQGELVRANIPDIAIPQPRVRAKPNIVSHDSEGFGL